MLHVTLKGLIAHKTRFIATLLAVLLGISFLAGTMVLTDTITRAFNDLFADVNRGVDAYVRSAQKISGGGQGDAAQRRRLDDTLVATVAAVPGVEAAEPQIIADFTQIIAPSGKALGRPGMGAPTLGGNWVTTAALNPFRIAEGTAPAGDADVVIDRGSAQKGDIHVGDGITISVPNGGPAPFRVSGIATFGSADSPLGATYALFTLPTAQRVLAQPGKIDGISIRAAGGISQDDVASRVRQALPAGTEVLTGAALTTENQNDFQQNIAVFTIFFGAFAAVSIVVGGFVIFNTFSIVTAQRSREMALLRAIGATRRQILTSVVIEALVVGFVGAVMGVLGGLLIAVALKALFSAIGLDIPATGLVLRPPTVIVGLVIGTLVTVLSALIPAVRASRVPPLAALRDVAVERTSLSRGRAITGVILGGGGVLMVLSGTLGGAAGGIVALGSLLVLVGTVVLGPVVARPATRVLGLPAQAMKGVVGSMSRQNAMRNPRRTAATASALLIGVGVVSLLTVLYGSFRQSIDDQINRSFTGDVTVSTGSFDRGGVSPELARRLAALPQVSAAAALRFGHVDSDGSLTRITAADPRVFNQVIDVETVAGSVATLSPDQIAIFEQTAKDRHIGIGDSIRFTFAETGEKAFTVTAIYHRGDIAGEYLISTDAYDANVPNPLDALIFVKFKPGVTFADGRAAVEGVASAFPTVRVQDQNELKQTFEARIRSVFTFMLIMLLLAILIALLGIANTIRLSVYERTRELGLLRAVGMTRRQLRSSLRWESGIIATFGTVGGLLLGLFFGFAIVHSLGRTQEVAFAPPAALMLAILPIGAVAGVVASLRPASRAAKLDVLAAISTE
jgi:putative ABC transport system permease protein